MQGTAIPLIGGTILAALVAALYVSTSSHQSARARQGEDAALIAAAEQAVRRELEDLGDDEIRDAYVSDRGGYPIVCGWVTARDMFRQPIGFQRFFAAGKAGGLYIEQRAPADFDVLWRELCGG
jgi:hypothetical protein